MKYLGATTLLFLFRYADHQLNVDACPTIFPSHFVIVQKSCISLPPSQNINSSPIRFSLHHSISDLLKSFPFLLPPEKTRNLQPSNIFFASSIYFPSTDVFSNLPSFPIYLSMPPCNLFVPSVTSPRLK